MNEKERIILFTGHFGSGKTEFSINYGIQSAKEGNKTILVDLDIVNPFFRSSEVKDLLGSNNIKLISPNYAMTTVDVPSLPAELFSVFVDKSARIIFDVGGDEDGARALGTLYNHFMKEPYRMFNVINTKRPLSSTKEDIIDMVNGIQIASRLKVTDLINNTNLSYETKASDIVEGQAIVESVSEELSIPITYIGGTEEVKQDLPLEMRNKFFPLQLFMKPPW